MHDFLNTKEIPEPANIILAELAYGIQNIQFDFIKGMYLTGSIPLNDFHPDKSDIDFLILCKNSPDKKLLLQLDRLHKTILNRYKKPDLSGCYLTIDKLNARDPSTMEVLSFREGKMRYEKFGMGTITLYELRTSAFSLTGIPAGNLPIVIGPCEVNAFLHQNINSYWKSWIRSHSSLGFHQLLLLFIPRLTEWVILGVARQLYTLRTGKIASKIDAGYYCLDHLPGKFHNIIKEAIKIRKERQKPWQLVIKHSYRIYPSLSRFGQTLDCANFIIDLFNKEYEISQAQHPLTV